MSFNLNVSNFKFFSSDSALSGAPDAFVRSVVSRPVMERASNAFSMEDKSVSLNEPPKMLSVWYCSSDVRKDIFLLF